MRCCGSGAQAHHHRSPLIGHTHRWPLLPHPYTPPPHHRSLARAVYGASCGRAQSSAPSAHVRPAAARRVSALAPTAAAAQGGRAGHAAGAAEHACVRAWPHPRRERQRGVLHVRARARRVQHQLRARAAWPGVTRSRCTCRVATGELRDQGNRGEGGRARAHAAGGWVARHAPPPPPHTPMRVAAPPHVLAACMTRACPHAARAPVHGAAALSEPGRAARRAGCVRPGTG
jgi:hypothetical protein